MDIPFERVFEIHENMRLFREQEKIMQKENSNEKTSLL